MAGWIKLHRDIQEHWLWEDEPFSRGQAFIDLLMEVNHEDRKVLFNGELIEIKRGSKITSLRKLGERWKWSICKVKKFLEQLQKDGMITYKSDNKKTLVTIEKYSVYQSRENTEKTDKEHRNYTEQNQNEIKTKSEQNQNETNKNDKEYIKNVKEREEWEEGEEEKVPSLPPLSFPTQIHEKFYEQWGEVAYRTWFYDAVVVEGEIITISSPDNFKNEILRSKYKEDLEILTGKKVEIGG